MDYRALAQVEKQWPDVGGEDLYYGGNAYENGSGLGRLWLAETEGTEAFDIPCPAPETEGLGLRAVRVAALYTPGMLIDKSAVVASRVARPTMILHAADAGEMNLADGDRVTVTFDGRELEARTAVVDDVQQGLVLLRGVPFWPGLLDVQIRKIEEREKEMVA